MAYLYYETTNKKFGCDTLLDLQKELCHNFLRTIKMSKEEFIKYFGKDPLAIVKGEADAIDECISPERNSGDATACIRENYAYCRDELGVEWEARVAPS